MITTWLIISTSFASPDVFAGCASDCSDVAVARDASNTVFATQANKYTICYAASKACSVRQAAYASEDS